MQDEARIRTVLESEKGVNSSSLVSEIMRIQISKCCQLHDPTWAAHCQERLWKNFHHLPVYPDVNLLFSHKLPFVMVSVRSNEPVLTVNCCDCFLCRISGFLSASALSFVQAVMNDLCQRQKIVVVIPI